MAVSGREDLRNKLKKGEIAPVYLLFGAEKHLRDLAAKTIAEMVLKDAPLREFNETESSLTDTDFRQAIASAEQLPMISSRRIVKISDINKLKEADEDLLAAYVARPAETSVVIFTAEELDKRRRFVKTLIDGSVAVEFNQLNDAELTVWAKGKLKELNTQIDDRTLREIIVLVGNNLLRLSNELEKLAVAALPEKIITFETVESLVSNSRELSNFELTDRLLNKNRTQAFQILKKILDDGAEPIMLLGLIANNFRRLFLAKELMAQGVERAEVARNLKLPYGKQEEFLANARRADAVKLAWNMKRIAEADLNIKTSKATPRLQIEMLVAELTA